MWQFVTEGGGVKFGPKKCDIFLNGPKVDCEKEKWRVSCRQYDVPDWPGGRTKVFGTYAFRSILLLRLLLLLLLRLFVANALSGS